MVAHKSVFSQVAQHVPPPPRLFLRLGTCAPTLTLCTLVAYVLSPLCLLLPGRLRPLVLPLPLLAALWAELLDDPGVLCEHPREDVLTTDEKLEGGVAPSGAASSGQLTISSLDLSSTSLPGTRVASAGTTTASLAGSAGTDPKTGCSGLGSSKGTDQKTRLSPVGMNVEVVGGDPRTDHASVPCETQTSQGMAATCPPYRPGAVALQTANPDSPALFLDPCLSNTFVREDLDELTHENGPSVPDELPSAGETDMNTTSDCETTLFPGIFRIAEQSEELRDPDFGVQIVPASVSPSELSAHQMGAALAGISDRALSTERYRSCPF